MEGYFLRFFWGGSIFFVWLLAFGFWRLLAPSVSGFWLVFVAFWSQNLWFACYLLQFGANLHAHLAFGFWLLAPSVSGFWLVFAAFWSPRLWFACYLLQFGANLHAHLAFGFFGFWLLACICCILEPKSLICLLFAAVWSQFACPFGFWLLAPSVSGF